MNWDDKMENMQKLLDSWRTRNLTIFGKIQVIKSLAMSKLVYSAINTTTPIYVYSLINKIIYAFIWNGKRDRIKRSVMLSSIKEGGVNMIDIETFFNSLKVTWINRLFSDTNATWNSIGLGLINSICPINILLRMNFVTSMEFPPITKLPSFLSTSHFKL